MDLSILQEECVLEQIRRGWLDWRKRPLEMPGMLTICRAAAARVGQCLVDVQ